MDEPEELAFVSDGEDWNDIASLSSAVLSRTLAVVRERNSLRDELSVVLDKVMALLDEPLDAEGTPAAIAAIIREHR